MKPLAARACARPLTAPSTIRFGDQAGDSRLKGLTPVHQLAPSVVIVDRPQVDASRPRSEEVGFAHDSALERSGFERSVPH